MGVATNLLTCFLYRADKNRTFEDMYYMLEIFFFIFFCGIFKISRNLLKCTLEDMKKYRNTFVILYCTLTNPF